VTYLGSDQDNYPLIEHFENYFIFEDYSPLQKWKFENEFLFDLDGNLETPEGKGYAIGNVYLSKIESGLDALKIEGRISLRRNLPNQTPKIYLIATDGMDKEIASTKIPFNLISYSQIDEKIYSFSLSLLNPPKPINGGHYEVYLELGNNPFLINTTSKISKHYFPLIHFPEKKVLIYEVYYDVATGTDPDNEWIILHNLENEPVDISGWEIVDNYATDTIPQSSIIPANGFAIITASSTTFDFWKIPKGMTKIVLEDKRIGNGLANFGDRVILKDKEGNVVDAMSYGNDKTIFDNPPKAREGYSLLRDPPDKDTDTGEDFKESEPTIGKNHPPIPIISFSPKNPVKGVKVKFDASSSIDPDGEIVNFEWQIGTSTSTGTTTEFTFNENDEYQITLTVTDNDGATSSTSTTLKVEPFSFAIITDLHIGRGYPDYGNEGFDDEDNGEEYYLTQRLRNVVSWVNEHKENYSFKFLAVLGDIADTAEKSEFCKAKEILDGLEIPYIPIFGNHDVWPYTEKESATTTLGEDFFERIFWSTSSIPCENSSSTRNFETLLREFNFERDIQNPKFKNFTFTFGGIHFIGLDFNSREKACETECGVKAEGVLHNETISWLREKLNKLGGKETVIILSHEPFAKPYSRWLYSEFPPLFPDKRGNFDSKEIEEIQKILNEYEALSEGQQILVNFGGHIHGFEKFGKEKIPISPVDLFMAGNWEYPSLSNISVITTEALMVGTNEKDEDLNRSKYDKGILRIVRILGSGEIYFNETAAKYNPDTGNGKEFVALNPYISWAYKFLENSSNTCIFLKSHPFTNRDISLFEWDLGNGEKRYGKVIPLYCYSATGTYTITSTVTDAKTGWKEWITRRIEIKEGLFSKIIKIKNELKEKAEIISQKIGENLLEFGNYLIKGKDRILLKIKHSPSTPVAELIIDFEEATGDVDLSQTIFDSNLKEKKSILYMSEWPKVVKEKILLLPK
jgi:PKD repeat protein